jgi:excisionase family DNA binding protein
MTVNETDPEHRRRVPSEADGSRQSVVTDADRLEPLFSPSDVAEYLGVPVKTLYRWRYLGVGPPALRVGRHVRYRRSDVERWVEQRIEVAERG